LNKELEKIEKPAGLANPREFRAEIVKFHDRSKGANNGKIPRWNSFEKIKEVIEKKVFANFDEILPIISFSKKISEDDQKKHHSFVDRMKERGYTLKQIKLLVEWFTRYKNNN
jgi:serine protein kinase